MEDMRALSYGLGQQYFEDRDYRGAIRALPPGRRRNPRGRRYPAAAGPRLLPRGPPQARRRAPLEVIEREPTEYYAHLMLARTLERQSRRDEATKHRRIAAALTGDDELLEPHTI